MTESQVREVAKVVFVLIVVIAVAMGASSDSTTSTSPTGPTGPSDDLYKQCENAVKDELKAPSTAQFSNERGNSFVITGSVDSENGFGAMLRSEFKCTITGTEVSAIVV